MIRGGAGGQDRRIRVSRRAGGLGGFRYLNGVPLNKSHLDLWVNDLDEGEIGKDGKEYPCLGITGDG
jgi:hypothetical protein